MRPIIACLLAYYTLLPDFAHSADLARQSENETCTEEQSISWRGATFRLENDLFAGTDRNYTNGMAVTTVSHDLEGELIPDCLPNPPSLYTRFLGWVDRGFWQSGGARSVSQNLVMRVGQAMYTPDDKVRTDLIRDDRPYAGLLYLGLGWNQRRQPQNAGYEMLDSRELALGVIGPWSLAEESQDLVHNLRGIDRFSGWDNQLNNEPAFLLALERKFKPSSLGAVEPGFSSDVIGSYALRLGNIETSASAGFELRTGWNIPNDFGSYSIRPGGENRPPSSAARLRTTQPDSTHAPRPGVHTFANLEAKAVLWDFSLDGNLFSNSHHVKRRPFVLQGAIGISSQWLVSGHGVRLALMRVWRTREFDEQNGHHAFGSVAISLEI